MLEYLNTFFKKIMTREGLLIGLIVCLIIFVGYRYYQKYQHKAALKDAEENPIVEGMEGDSKQAIPPPPVVKKDGVYFDLAVGENEVGRIEMELFKELVPKTCKNFEGLCAGYEVVRDAPKDEKTGRVFKPYMGTVFHRLIPGFMLQGGDYENGDGTGGASIWGGKFEDENFTGGGHRGTGVLSMANSGPNSNGSQFFITLGDAGHLDGKHVVFGRVSKGMEIIEKLAQIRTDDNDRPMMDVMIIDCGKL